jgi:hypothetical protein
MKPRRAIEPNKKEFFKLTASGLSWINQIAVRDAPVNRAGVYFTGTVYDEDYADADNEYSGARDLNDFCLGFVSKNNLVRNVAILLHKMNGRFKHSGRGLSVRGCSPAQAALLDVCWQYNENELEWEDAAEFLLMLSSDELESSHEVFRNFESEAFLKFLQLFTKMDGEPDLLNQLKRKFGLELNQEWFRQALDYLILESIAQDQREADRLLKLRALQEIQKLKTFGRPNEVSDFSALAARFSNRIPAGYLVHVTQFSRPPVGEITDALLRSWARYRRLPTRMPEDPRPIISITGRDWGSRDEDECFLRWISDGGRDTSAVERLSFYADSESQRCLKKIAGILRSLKERTKQKPSGGMFAGMAYKDDMHSYSFYSKFEPFLGEVGSGLSPWKRA